MTTRGPYVNTARGNLNMHPNYARNARYYSQPPNARGDPALTALELKALSEIKKILPIHRLKHRGAEK